MKNLEFSHCGDVELRHCAQKIKSIQGSAIDDVLNDVNACHCGADEIRHSNPVVNLLSFSRCNNVNRVYNRWQKLVAFTLAEVLITLGIIGVVAALTIPGLIANAQKKAAVSGLMEAQSILNQAVKAYAYECDEDGGSDFDTTLTPQKFAEKYFKPYLNVARVCTSMADGCWKTKNFYGYSDLAGTPVKDSVAYSLVLNNGMIVGFNKITGTNLISLIVDINGKGKNNIMGKDVFVFYTYNRDNLCSYALPKWKNIKNGIYPGGFDDCGAPHVAYERDELLAKKGKILRPCSKNGNTGGATGGGRSGMGTACAALIFKDGWKISKDYPWN